MSTLSFLFVLTLCGRMEIIMDKNEILALSREENKGKDVADIEAQHRGAYAAYFVGILLIIAVDIIEGAVFNRIEFCSHCRRLCLSRVR